MTTQYTSVYKRIAQSGDAGASTTWTQASSQRIATHIMALRKSGGCDVVDFDTASQSNDVTASSTGLMAISTATANGQMGLAFGSSIVASFGAPVVVASAGWTQTTAWPIPEGRMVAGYRSLDDAEETTGTFTADFPGYYNNGWACVSVVVG